MPTSVQNRRKLFIVKEQIEVLKKKLASAEEVAEQAEQDIYHVGVKETEESFKAQIIEVCRGFCLQIWSESLNQAGVDASSVLRRLENTFYPLALEIVPSPSTQAALFAKASGPDQVVPASTPSITSEGLSEPSRASTKEKGKEVAKEKQPELAKPLPLSQDSAKEKGAAQGQVLVLATLPFTTKEGPQDPKDKGTTPTTMLAPPALPTTKEKPPLPKAT